METDKIIDLKRLWEMDSPKVESWDNDDDDYCNCCIGGFSK